jgi:hypothetical protein
MPKERGFDQALEAADGCRRRDLRASFMRDGWRLCPSSLDGTDLGAASRSPLHDALLWRAQIADVANSAIVIFEGIAPVAVASPTVIFTYSPRPK